MRFGVSLLALFLLSGCSAMLMGGGSGGQSERGSSVESSDSEITSMITWHIRNDSSLNSFGIGVNTYKGSVTLTGLVSNQTARDKAASIAKETKGVVAVNNLIRIER